LTSFVAVREARNKWPVATQVTPGTTRGQFSRSWLFRYATGEIATSKTGKARKVERAMGLGSFSDVSLAEARQKAAGARRLREQGHDPIEHRDTQQVAAAASQAKTITFAKAAEKPSVATKRRGATKFTVCSGATPSATTSIRPSDILQCANVGLVMQVLEPIWTTIPETASRLRGRIERVLGWARVNGYREGENPARWTDNLAQLLPARARLGQTEPQPALPYQQIGAFMAELRGQVGVAARCLALIVLTAVRSGEARGARWSELAAGNVWVIPAGRTKGNREHRVMLSSATVTLIERMRKQRCGDYVFPGDTEGEPLPDITLRELLQRMNKAREAHGLPRWTDPKQGSRDVVVHGFRSCFKDWASECTSFRDAVSEAALGHVSADKVRAAYERTTFERQRRELAELWAQFCDAPGGAPWSRSTFHHGWMNLRVARPTRRAGLPAAS
jgi:integrase